MAAVKVLEDDGASHSTESEKSNGNLKINYTQKTWETASFIVNLMDKPLKIVC